MRYIEKKRNYRIGMLVFIFAVLVFHVFLGAQYLKVDKKEHLGYENEIAKLNSELKKILDQKKEILKNNEKKAGYTKKINEVFSNFKNNLAESERIDMSELLDHIQTAARSINLTLNAMSSKKGQPLPEYPEIDFRIIDLSLTGEYTQAKHFLFKLEKLPYFLMKHHEMKITGKDRIVNINIKLRIPFLKNY